MTVLTIFFCGTGFNNFDFYRATFPQGELVSTLARNMAGEEHIDWFIVDGPGSGNLQKQEKFVDSPSGFMHMAFGKSLGYGMESSAEHAVQMVRGKAAWAPTPRPLRNEQLEPGRARRQQFREDQAVRQRVFEQRAAAVVRGSDGALAQPSTIVKMEDRSMVVPHERDFHRIARKGAVRRKNHVSPSREGVRPEPAFRPTAQALVEQKQAIARRNRPITAINIVGWSRGAVTAHVFSHKLYRDPALRHIPINIIAVDPVAGWGNNGFLEKTSLAPNVMEYVCFYARDEWKPHLDPMKAALPGTTRATFYSVPGGHSTVVGKPDVGGEFPSRDTRKADWSNAEIAYRLSPAKLVRRLAESYLTDWGTVLLNRLPCSDEDLLSDYDDMIGHRRNFKKVGTQALFSSVLPRKILLMQADWKWKNPSHGAWLDGSNPCFINLHHRRLFEKRHPMHTWSSGQASFCTKHTWDAVQDYMRGN